MNKAGYVELVRDQLHPVLAAEQRRLEVIDQWYRWQHEDVVTPRGATNELKSLLQLSKTPWLGLVVTNVAQSMYVDGYRTSEATEAVAPWKLWQANDLDGRQVPVHRAALAYGQAYVTALPAVGADGAQSARLRGVSPRKMLAWYEDPAEDDWPLYAFRDFGGGSYRLYDDERVHFLGIEDGKWVYIEERVHGVGVCPVIRFANMLDLDGRTDGEVEPFIPLAKAIDKTAYDLLLTQHFSSWKVRTIAGMAEPDGQEAENRSKLKLRQDDILIAADPDTKFGTLPETPLDGFIRAYESRIKTLAAASQTPVHAMVGDLINLSAEALAAARASLDAKVAERRRPFGKAWDQALRLGSYIAGDYEAATDVMAHVTWEDTSIQSLASAADALGKMATMLGVPPQALWSRIPGVTKTDVEEWKLIAEQAGDPLAALVAELGAGQTSPTAQLTPDEIKQAADAMGVLIRAGVEPNSAAARVGLTGVEFTGAVPTSLRLPSADATQLEGA